MYYEVGLRHAAKETDCVLLAALWSKQLFDIEQFRSIRYPLKDGSVPDDEATNRAAIIDEFVVAACERTLARNEGDDWLKPTLLGAAFRACNVDKAQELAERVALEGSVEWKLKSTLADLADA